MKYKAKTKKKARPSGGKSYAGKAPPAGTPGPFAVWGTGKHAGY